MAAVLFTRRLRDGRPEQAVLFKNAWCALLLGLAGSLAGAGLGGGAAGRGDLPWLLLSGALSLGCGDLLFFQALRHIGVGRSFILSQLTIVLISLLAWWRLDQELSSWQWLGALCVIAGGVLVESRHLGGQQRRMDAAGVLMALASSLCYATGIHLSHWGLDTTGPLTGSAWRLAGGGLAVLVYTSLRSTLGGDVKSLVSKNNLRGYFLPTLLGTALALSFATAGLKWAKQGVSVTLASTAPLFSLPMAVWLLHERPGWRGWCGAAVAVLGAALITLQ